MPIDIARLSDDQLKSLIENHRRQNATAAPAYMDALREWQVRKGKGLDFDKSFRIIKATARERRFLSYKELADASDADWGQVHYSIGNHLWALVEFAHRKGWPMLSAIVVNKSNVSSGALDPETLKGFIGAARDLGYTITDEEAFLREQQAKVFAWATADAAA
ncbi:MAG: hypothetical protein WA184_23010 [Stellaceae bacterium]|jgi:hypothetical protein